MLIVGLAVTTDPLVADNPAAGDHAYVIPPVAVNTSFEPWQAIDGAAGAIVAIISATLQPHIPGTVLLISKGQSSSSSLCHDD